MPLTIDGVTYRSVSEVLTELSITRQTLWRWRQLGLVPAGRLFRGQRVVFTAEEFAAVRSYANRVEPPPSAVRATGTAQHAGGQI